jgi:hypothetical protein
VIVWRPGYRAYMTCRVEHHVNRIDGRLYICLRPFQGELIWAMSFTCSPRRIFDVEGFKGEKGPMFEGCKL